MKLETPPGSGNYKNVDVPPENVPGTEVFTTPGLVPEEPTVVITDPTVTTTTDVGAAHRETVFNVDTNVGHDHLDIITKLDVISAKVDHLLEHMHQPLSGTVTLECPTKVPSGSN
tara:strand:- start:254 stop:598 length:345 start_codon:yes stop_codon:yes gene_type:complete